jgi:AcrR family transcriptional regulator
MSVQKLPRATNRSRVRMTRPARREQLLEAATRAFVRGGYHGTTVDDVIAEAGVARGTFYLHFESKHAVFETLVERMLAVLFQARPNAALPEVLDIPSARRALRQNYRAVLDVLHRHADLFRLLMEEAAGADKGFDDRLTAHRAAWQKRVRDRISAMVDSGVARRDVDRDVTAWAIIGMVEMVVRLYVLRGHDPDLDRLADALAEFDMRGLTGR